MTKTDAYVVVTRLAILFTPIVLGAWWFEHRDAIKPAWREFRQRNRDIRNMRRWRQSGAEIIPLTPNQITALRDGKVVWVHQDAKGNVVGSGVEVPMVVGIGGGTVQNPTDPSPSPRIRRLIEEGIRQQDRAAKLRAEAEWEAQR